MEGRKLAGEIKREQNLEIPSIKREQVMAYTKKKEEGVLKLEQYKRLDIQ